MALKRLAIIPARGGSKRLPGKNIMDFMGKPIIEYTIDAAQQTGLFADIVVNTDDDNAAAIAQRCGVSVFRRGAHLGTDESSINDVCMDYLQRFQAENNWQELVILYATAPLRSAEDISATVALLEAGECEVAMAVTHYDHPVHQALLQGDDGYTHAAFPQWIQLKSQHAPKMLVGNGSTYATWVDFFMQTQNMYPQKLKTYVMPPERSVDIDTRHDYDRAVFYAQRAGIS